MTKEPNFVALKAFRFGAEHLQPGDPVPVEAGRDYRLMQRLGQIAPAGSVTASAAAQQETPLLTPFQEGETVLFVAEDGTFVYVVFQDVMEVPDEAREGLGLGPGDLVGLVEFPDDPDNATFVPMDSLLPEHPARVLTDALAEAQKAEQAWQSERQALLTDVATAREREDEVKAKLADAESRVTALEAELQGARAAPVLPPDALKRIEGVKGVGEKLAEAVLAALTAPAEPPPAEIPPPESGG